MTKPQHYEQLQYDEHVAIAGFRDQGLSIRAMSRILNRAASTVSCEILRNAPSGKYSCIFAQKRRNRRRILCRSAPKLVLASGLFAQVCDLLKRKWSPEQIAIYLRRQFPDDSSQRVSHETIYNAIYAMPKGELRKELIAAIRRAQAKRMPRSRGQQRRGKIVDMVSIHVRPPEVNDRVFPGHWEADLVKGKANASAVGTLVERTSRLLRMVYLPGPKPASAATVLQAFTDKLRSIAQPLAKGIC